MSPEIFCLWLLSSYISYEVFTKIYNDPNDPYLIGFMYFIVIHLNEKLFSGHKCIQRCEFT